MNNEVINESTEITIHFNKYFCGVGEIIKKITAGKEKEGNFEKFEEVVSQNSLYLKYVTCK